MLIHMVMDNLPLWALYPSTAVLIILAVEVGILLGRYRRRCRERKGVAAGSDAPAGIVVAAMLGLVAFMLGFTFSYSASIFANRRQLLIREANAIGTAYLRTRMLPAQIGAESRLLLHDYVALRVDALKNPTATKIRKAITDSDILLDKLWVQAVALTRLDRKDPIEALYIASLNDVIDIHSERVASSRWRIPDVIWFALYGIMVLSVGILGFCFGITGKGGLGLNIFMAMVLSIIILLIADLDRPTEGTLRTSQQPLIELQQKLNESAP